MKSFLILLTVVLLVFPCVGFGQETPQDQPQEQTTAKAGYFGIYGGISSPMGDFADDDADDSGFANLGFAVGAEYTYNIANYPGLGWLTSASFIYNPADLTRAQVQEMVNELSPVYVDVTSHDSGHWINIPILTGLRFGGDPSPNLHMYGLGQIGLNISFGPTIDAKGEDAFGDPVTGKVEIGSATGLGLCIGGGVILNKKINISLRYMNMGEVKQDAEGSGEGEQVDLGEKETKISMLLIMVGFNFGG